MRDAAGFLMGPILGGYLGVLTIDGLSSAIRSVGPELEATFSPVVRIEPVVAPFRDHDRLCFDLRITKLHAAVPIKYAFFAEAQLSERIPLAAYLTDEARRRLASGDLITHAVGQSWVRHYCTGLDRRIAELDIRITGYALHRRHPLYDTPTPVPPFTVPAPRERHGFDRVMCRNGTPRRKQQELYGYDPVIICDEDKSGRYSSRRT